MALTVLDIEKQLAELNFDLRIMSKEAGAVAKEVTLAENEREMAVAEGYLAAHGNSVDRRQAGNVAAGKTGVEKMAAHARCRTDVQIALGRVTALSSLLKSMNSRANDNRYNAGP